MYLLRFFFLHKWNKLSNVYIYMPQIYFNTNLNIHFSVITLTDVCLYHKSEDGII